ncbi:26S proteasome regulatory complex, subunit Rpn2/Psmd1 [Rhizoctonia solani]|uniref:26S proteasome regulatory subunit RPN2 n=1 Tax=Rhizoctonia solani TaxID=456999 RepID=A0A8H8NTS9_9AGAM|nr:26S proteasome regulatory complex, subunit Rpn2/Psmd1 [Rhizoctonia solani]QRW18607.1 26S proteasome regulatory complex, subunit Rpn2/Psmd1 [Rhizoctonia solani]
MVAHPRTSAAGILALLAEPELEIKQRAIVELIQLIPDFWAEISEEISAIEALSESSDLQPAARENAALVASKVYYYLGQYDDALSFALRAGNAFEAELKQEKSAEYAETIVSNAIDRYIAQRVEFAETTDPSTLPNSGADSDKIDSRLRSIIERIFTLAIEGGDVRQALGIALESSRLDIVTRIFEHTHDTELLSYAMDAVLDVGFNLATRNRVLHHLCPLFPLPKPGANYTIALTRLHVALATPSVTNPLFQKLIESGDKTNRLLACQLAFDLVEGSTQDFLRIVSNSLPSGENYELIRQILSGADSIRLKLDFLQRNNKVDLAILKHTKESLEHRSSVYHNALTLSNAFMHAGTTSDVFLRNNLDWLGRASNWSKFSATGAFGVIHKGNVAQAMELLGPYLPGASSGAGSSPFSEGGALFALGIVHAGRGSEVEGFLREKVRQAAGGEVVQHGAALGLGIAGMASRSEEAYDELKEVLFTDSAIASEAAAYAMGLVMLGSGQQKATDEMLAYAHETQHEKIIRGLAIGVAFLYYGRQESADTVIENALKEKDPLLRYGGVYTLALAYAGTGDSRAVRKLLHVAVSDTSDDVRRAAVTALAFLLFKSPTQVPRIVQLLSESYNPHVRCGATLALGLACAGTGLQDAIDLLQPMTKDPVDFVRQGAFISLGMILVQQSEASSPSLSSTRALYHKIVSDKHEDPMARFGAALGQGFIDAGGRNCSISLQSRTGSGNMSAIVGMVLFCQFWYWYPLAHCACLAFEPTGVIGLTEELKTPSFEFVSNARPALFAYPAAVKPPTKETVEKVATAVLSTTAKAKAREKTKEKEKAANDGERMDTDESPAAAAQDDEMKVDEPAPAPTPKRAGPAPTSETLQNLSRVTPAQMQYITFPQKADSSPCGPSERAEAPFGTESASTENMGAQTEGQSPAAQQGSSNDEAPPPPAVQNNVFCCRSSEVEKWVFDVQKEVCWIQLAVVVNMVLTATRRKKCDETRPICERCTKAGMQCLGYEPEGSDSRPTRVRSKAAARVSSAGSRNSSVPRPSASTSATPASAITSPTDPTSPGQSQQLTQLPFPLIPNDAILPIQRCYWNDVFDFSFMSPSLSTLPFNSTFGGDPSTWDAGLLSNDVGVWAPQHSESPGNMTLDSQATTSLATSNLADNQSRSMALYKPHQPPARTSKQMTSGQASLLNALFSLGQSTPDCMMPTPNASFSTPPSTTSSAWPSPDQEGDESDTSEDSDPEGVREIVCGSPTLEPTVQSNTLPFVLYSYATMVTRTVYEPLKMASHMREWLTDRFYKSEESRTGITTLAGIFHTIWNLKASPADYLPLASRIVSQFRQKITQASSTINLATQSDMERLTTLGEALEIINLQMQAGTLRTTMELMAETAPLFRSACPEAPHELIDLPAKLTHPDISLRHFVTIDVILSAAVLRPMHFRYKTHCSKDFRDREDWGLQWFNGVPGELILIMARINMLVVDYWANVDPEVIAEIERQLKEFKSAPGKSPDAYLMVARLAVQECWRLAVLVYLYMCLCGADAKDPRVEKAQRSFMRVLDRTKPNRTPDVFLLAPMTIVGRATYRPRERDIIRRRLLNIQECAHPGTCGNDAVRILEAMWTRSDAEGRSVVWSDGRLAVRSVCGI